MNALTTDHILTLLTVGVLISAGLSLVTEFVVKPSPDAAWHDLVMRNQGWLKRWLPVLLGIPVALVGFPLLYSQIVGNVTDDWRFWALGAFLGLVAGTGAWFAHDVAKAVIGKVGK